jgi:hypothetical protein
MSPTSPFLCALTIPQASILLALAIVLGFVLGFRVMHARHEAYRAYHRQILAGLQTLNNAPRR